MQTLALVSLFSPLLAFFFACFFCLSSKKLFVALFCLLCVGVSAFCSLYLLFLNQSFNIRLFEWFLGVNFGFDVDAISLSMMSIVGVVSSCVFLYSIFYMADDEGFNKFFAYLSLFVFSMMFLVMSDNFLGLFIGWEGVGLCSWLLIGFWYQNNTYSYAANEAFIMNRITDLAMLLGIFCIYISCNSLNYNEVFAQASSLEHSVLLFIACCLFIGAMGKSAQFPFHTWLATAMAGPTPVSALIHAATMVTAGVYLLIRANVIYDFVPEFSYFIACLGAFVALFAASMALCASDLKKIIAYSTLSQLGYMFVAAGLGAYGIALFHLATHAFFKSLLFLGAGNVMHSMHNELNIKKMGGLFKYMKLSAIFMAIGSLALSGVYPFAGFFSKDLILSYSFMSFHHGIFAVLLLAAFLTSFYSFRLLMLVFFTEKRHNGSVHKQSKLALVAMSPLLVLAVISGFFEHSFFEYVSTKLVFIDAKNSFVVILASCVCVSGILFAIFVYKARLFKNAEENILYKLLHNEYFIPKFYSFLVDKFKNLSIVLRHCDIFVLDGFVNKLALLVSNFSKAILVKTSLSFMIKALCFASFVLLILVRIMYA